MPKNPYNLTPSTLKGTLPRATGDVIFVDSVNGSSSGDGSSLRPFDSINNAFAKTGLSFGDIIVAMAGHVETISAAASLALSVAGIRVIADPSAVGTKRPTINFTTATTATVTVTAANCSLEGFYITMQGVDAVVSGIVVSAADFSFLNNEVLLADATYQATLGILTTTGANRMKVVGNFFHGSVDAGTTSAIKLLGGDSIVIKDNVFIGAYSASLGAINSVSTAQTNLIIQNNLINNLTASSTKVVVLLTGSTGQISDNKVQILSGLAPFTGDAMSIVGNKVSNVIATEETSMAAGSSFVIQSTVTSSSIPNNTQTAGAITSAAVGAILVEDIILETGTTGIVAPTNLEITTDNVSGLTGAAAPNVLQAVSALGANKTVVCKTSSTTKVLPFTLESGKKIYIDGDDAAGTGAGTVRVTMICRRISPGASLTAANL